MKKFLLLTLAAATVTVVMAQQKANLPKSPVENLVKKNTNKAFNTKVVNLDNTITLKQLKADFAKAQTSKRAADDNGEQGISEQVYVINDFMGVTQKNMFSEIKYYVADQKAYLSLYGLDYMEGTVETESNKYSSMGADSITFNLGTVGFESKNGKFVYGAATVAMTKTAITATRNDMTTIGAYYFAENKELYIPALSLNHFIAIFNENGENPTAPVAGTLIANPDIQPASYINKHVSKATWTAKEMSYNSQTNQVETKDLAGGDAHVYLAYDGYYVSGIYPASLGLDDAWVFMEKSDDGTQVTISPDQVLGTVEFYVDEARTTTDEVIFTPVSLLTDYSNWADDETSVLFIEEDAKTETTTISSDGMTSVSLYGWSKTKDLAGTWFDMTDFAITITYELDGINEVKTTRSNSDVTYNMAGQRISKDYKGLVIRNGKKIIKK